MSRSCQREVAIQIGNYAHKIKRGFSAANDYPPNPLLNHLQGSETLMSFLRMRILKRTLITFLCLSFIKSPIFRNERHILKFESVDSHQNQMHLVIMYILYRLQEICLQKNSTNFDKFLQNFPENAIALFETLDTFLFGTFCSDPTAQVRIFNKLMYVAE